VKADWAKDWVVLVEGFRLTIPEHVAEDIVDPIEGLYLNPLMSASSSPDPGPSVFLHVA
jgi:hypothetical protein